MGSSGRASGTSRTGGVRIHGDPAGGCRVDLDPGRDVGSGDRHGAPLRLAHGRLAGREAHDDAHREAQLVGHEGGCDRVLLGVAQHRAGGEEVGDALRRVAGPAEGRVADAVADVAVRAEGGDRGDELRAGRGRGAGPGVRAAGGRAVGGRRGRRDAGRDLVGHARGPGRDGVARALVGERLERRRRGDDRLELVRVARDEPADDRARGRRVVVVEGVGEAPAVVAREPDALEAARAGEPDAAVRVDDDVEGHAVARDARLVEAVRHAREGAGGLPGAGRVDAAARAAHAVDDAVVGVERRQPDASARGQAGDGEQRVPHGRRLPVGAERRERADLGARVEGLLHGGAEAGAGGVRRGGARGRDARDEGDREDGDGGGPGARARAPPVGRRLHRDARLPTEAADRAVPAAPAAAGDPQQRRREPRQRERHEEARGVGCVRALAAVGAEGGRGDEDHEGRDHRELRPAGPQRHCHADHGPEQHERERGHEEGLVVADRERDREQPDDPQGRALDQLAEPAERGPPAVDRGGRHRERHPEREEGEDDGARDDRAAPAEAGARDRDEHADRERDPRHADERRVAVHGPERGRGERREEGDREHGDEGAAGVAGTGGDARATAGTGTATGSGTATGTGAPRRDACRPPPAAPAHDALRWRAPRRSSR
ncbi:hypothetical protein QFZ62_002889 [Clavibacter sp. B3I6]|nr:hypothetical protein [Clavibacter sp. B3I6]